MSRWTVAKLIYFIEIIKECIVLAIVYSGVLT